MRRTGVIVAIAATLAGLSTSVATAAPINAKNASPLLIVCGSDTYQAVVNGNGAYTAAHSTTSNTVLIPVAFGPFTGTFTDTNGVTTTSTEPANMKGSSMPATGTLQTCTYYVQFSGPGGSFSGSGTVAGFIPGH